MVRAGECPPLIVEGKVDGAIFHGVVKVVVGDKKLEHAKAIAKVMKCPAGRLGTADEVANVAELLMSGKGAFITGSTFLMDGGATASYFHGPLKPQGSCPALRDYILWAAKR